MNNNISFFKRFRVYRHLSFLGILNHMFCNRLIKSKTLVANAPSLYKLSCTFPGKYLTNAIFRLTFNKLFTGGNSTEEVKRSAEYLERLSTNALKKIYRLLLIFVLKEWMTIRKDKRFWILTRNILPKLWKFVRLRKTQSQH